MKQGCYLPIVFAGIPIFLSLSSHFLYLSERFPSKNWHRERIVGWVGKYSILSIQFSRKMMRAPPSRGPLRPFSQILSLELEYATRAGVTKEKNKFDQSEGGGYRFGYGFRKRCRILFLRKPDKGSFTRIFSHTRRPHLHSSSYTRLKSERRISRTVYRIIRMSINSASENLFVRLKIFKTGLISNRRRGKSSPDSKRK